MSPSARAIGMDLIGFGESDKPDIEYRFFNHVSYVEGFIRGMGLHNITFVIHDWGSALGFHHAMRNESNVKKLAFAMSPTSRRWPSWKRSYTPTRVLMASRRR